MKVVRDPIHGFITLSADEWKIVNSVPFQRLRRIKQLGTSYLVYPSAEHNRFAHSLGVLHLATQMFNMIVEKISVEVLGWSREQTERNRQILRLAALLHDTGHAPFSHAAEHLFPVGLEHEDYTLKVITESEVTQIIERIGRVYGFTVGEVAGLISGRVLPEMSLMKQIVSSELDADKMDYLLRDSYHSGVEYGRYDLARVLETVNICSPEGGVWELAVETDGVHALEGLVLARYFMFVQVYLHKTRRVYDHILGQFLKSALPGGVYPADIREFLMWDDYKVIELAKSLAHENVWAERLVNRNHLKLVIDLSPHVKEDPELLLEIKRTLELKYQPEQVFIDEYKKSPIKFRANDNEPTIRLVDREEETYPVDEKSIVIKNFAVPIHIYRIYADREIAEDVRSIYNKKAKQMQGGRKR